MALTAEQWTLVKSIFYKVLEMPPSTREEWIAEQEQVPFDVRAEVLRLNEAAQAGSSFASPHSVPTDSVDDERLRDGEELLGRFEVLTHLGRGAMGDVYSAYDRELKEVVAIKTLRRHLAERNEFVLSMRREVQLARRVRHPNVCQIFDLHLDLDRSAGPLLFFTMELLNGQSLAARIAHGGMGLEEAHFVATGLAEGLEAIRTAGLIHRDLKPVNVFLLKSAPSPFARAVIADFGLCFDQARPYEETLMNFGPEAVVGTPAYMAVEQLLGQGATHRSDVYAFGVILFEMVTGRRPFEGETPLAIALRRLKDRPPSPREFRRDLPRSWERTILSCLEYESSKRPESAKAAVICLIQPGPLSDRIVEHRRKVVGVGLGALGIALSAKFIPIHHSPKPQAEYHLKLAVEFSHQNSTEGILNAIGELKEAIRIDAQYSQAWANLADVYCMASTYSALKPKEARALAEKTALHAISLDSSIARAHAAYAYALSGNLKRWRSAEPNFKEAIKLDPEDTSARSWYAGFLGRMGRFDEAIAVARSALSIDPASYRLNYRLGTELIRARRFSEALSHLLGVIKLHPAEGSGFCLLGRAYEWLKRFPEAEQALRQADELPDKKVSGEYWATLLAASGSTAKAQGMLDQVRRDWLAEQVETNVLLMVIGALAMALGESAYSGQMVSAIEEGIRREDETVLAAAANPYMQIAKSDARVVALFKQLALI